jgi:hypothetical protein
MGHVKATGGIAFASLAAFIVGAFESLCVLASG